MSRLYGSCGLEIAAGTITDISSSVMKPSSAPTSSSRTCGASTRNALSVAVRDNVMSSKSSRLLQVDHLSSPAQLP